MGMSKSNHDLYLFIIILNFVFFISNDFIWIEYHDDGLETNLVFFVSI